MNHAASTIAGKSARTTRAADSFPNSESSKSKRSLPCLMTSHGVRGHRYHRKICKLVLAKGSRNYDGPEHPPQIKRYNLFPCDTIALTCGKTCGALFIGTFVHAVRRGGSLGQRPQLDMVELYRFTALTLRQRRPQHVANTHVFPIPGHSARRRDNVARIVAPASHSGPPQQAEPIQSHRHAVCVVRGGDVVGFCQH